MTRHHRSAVITLIVASLGAAIPWGLATGAHTRNVDRLEVVLSVLHAVVAAVLLASLVVPRWRRWGDEALVLSAGAWAATSVLLGWLLQGATVPARFGLGLIFGSFAVLSFWTYAAVRREP